MRYLSTTLHGVWVYHVLAQGLILTLPLVVLADLLISPEYFAPHHACDTLAIPIFNTLLGMPIWVLIAGPLTFLIVWGASKSRVPGKPLPIGLFSFKPVNVIVNLLAFCLLAFLIYEASDYIWRMSWPHVIQSDCGGKAELVTRTLRLKFSLTPLFNLGAIWLVLHLRAMALSPKREDHIKTDSGSVS